jgi:hypothetical protein
MDMALIKSIEWFICALTATIVGLNTLGIDIFKQKNLKQLQTICGYVAGLAGVGSLMHFISFHS